MKEEQIKEIQLQFLENMKEFNYPKWTTKKNRQYSLNLSFSGVSHVARALTDLTLGYAGSDIPVTPFLGKVMEESLIGAFTCADAVNIQGMAIYADFVFHVVPKDLRIKK